MSYLESKEEWDGFWAEHGARPPASEEITSTATRSERCIRTSSYRSAGDWLGRILDASLDSRHGRRSSTRELELRLRARPGAARRLRHDSGARRVQKAAIRRHLARRSGDEPDPDALDLRRFPRRSAPHPAVRRPASPPSVRGLPGRRLLHRARVIHGGASLSAGRRGGRLVAFPNTAGYLMHILESASHQIPLARNSSSRRALTPASTRSRTSGSRLRWHAVSLRRASGSLG